MKPCCDLKGFLTFLVLRLISQQPRSGGEIRQEIKARRGRKPSSGTIYPVLKSLAGKGLIEGIEDGGKIKTYRVTRRGQRELKKATDQFLDIFFDMKDEFRRCR